uniref:CCHC-type domain-containing protein n=1 Tax=Oryza punctata TaxID=4537 RepID=A0A0E0LYG4_ORYPU
MDQLTRRNKNSSNSQDLRNMGINQPMLLSEDPLQVSNGSYHLTLIGRKTNVTCFGCGEKGHYVNKCPRKWFGNGLRRNLPWNPIWNMNAGIIRTPMPIRSIQIPRTNNFLDKDLHNPGGKEPEEKDIKWVICLQRLKVYNYGNQGGMAAAFLVDNSDTMR